MEFLDVPYLFFLLSYRVRAALAATMDSDSDSISDLDSEALAPRLVRLLGRVVSESGKGLSEIARLSQMKRDSLRRTLAGQRDASLSEVLRILDACDHRGEETLLMFILIGEDFAISQRGSDTAGFIGELFKRAPTEIVAQLGELATELRPRWAHGTARLLARTLEQHVSDLTRRGDAIGDRPAHGS